MYTCLNDDVTKKLDLVVTEIQQKNDGTLSESYLRDMIPELNNNYDMFSEAVEYLKDNKIEFDSEGVEHIDERLEDGVVLKPYDTSKIDIMSKTISLDIIIARLEHAEIDLMPGFQRKSGLWDESKKSQLIESIILKIPLPVFYFDGSECDKWLVIDGLQRLTAIKEFFITKKLRLTDLEFLRELNGCTCDEIPGALVRRMKETQIITYIIRPGSPVNLKYNIFKRINTGGLELEPQEIRHALFQGYSTEYLKDLADMELFKRATCYSVKTDRMLDREFVLRFIAFYEFGVEKYDGAVDNFLNEAMGVINSRYGSDRNHASLVKERFCAALTTSIEIFGKFAFRRMPDENRRRAISKALFEAWTALLAKRTDDEIGRLINNKERVKSDYIRMFWTDSDFVCSIGSGKASSVKKMFEKINNVIERNI